MSGKYALIIGNTEYIDPGLAQLTAPGKDAEDFARILKDKDLCAFDEVKIVLNQLSSSVIETVDEFFDLKKPDDMLVLYFSGHGVRDEMGLLYLAVKNTIRTRLRSTAIRSDYIREAMDQSRSKRQILILDCCNSGAFPQGTKAEVGGAMGMTRAFQGYGRFVLTASDATQFAWEGDKLIGQTDNSLFTHYLVKGLEGDADRDSDGKITVDELYEYAYNQISRVTPNQTPTKSSSKQEGEIVLRQITRIEDIKAVALPDDLISEIEDTRPAVREWAVQRLEKILKGKNIGMARSAREALEKIAIDDNTTRRVSQMATQLLEAVGQSEEERIAREKAEAEAKAKEDAQRLAAQKAEEERLAAEIAEAERKAAGERLAREKAEAERKAKEEARRLAREKAKAERLAVQKAEEERIAREKAEAEEKAKEETRRLAAQKAEAERIAREKAEAERKAKTEAERLLAEQKTEKERKAKEETERLATPKAKEEAERLAHAKASKIKGKREEFVYVILNDGTPLYQSLPTSNNWTAWLEKGSKLYITEPIEEVRQRIGKFGQYIEVLDEKGNEGYVRAATVSFTPTEPSSAAKEKKISGVDRTIEEPRDKAAKKTKRESLTQEPPKKEKLREDQPVAAPQTSSSRVGMIVIGLFLCGAAALIIYPRIIGAPAAIEPPYYSTEAPAATEPPYYPTEAPAATEPAATVEVVPFSGAYEAASGGGDMLTDRTLTLNTPVGGTLTFWTWYDLEPEYDYGFVEASTDDGATWAPLPGNITVTSDNPNTSDAWANSLVGGQATTDTAITGSSGGWVEATFTLPAASGVWVRFNYYTDGSANGQGWFIDDVSIDDFSDDFEDGTGVNWDLGGWTVTTTPSIEPTEPPATEAPVFVPTPASPFPDIPVEFVFGPQDGNLPHEADDLVEIEYASVSLRDFIVTATFQNPYSSSTGSWNYGFLFRDEYGNNQYRLIISSTNWWALRNHVDSTEGTTIQEGELPNLDVTDAAFNTIWLYCSGDYGELHVNGEFISSFDLSARQNFGDVSVGTGFYNDSEISGYSTDYFEFTVWEIR